MDKAGPNGDLGVVRLGVDVGLEKYVSSDEGEQNIRLPSCDEQGMGADTESMVEVCHGQTSVPNPSTNKLKLASDKIKCATLGKISDRGREGMDGNYDFCEEDSSRQACGMLYEGELTQDKDDPTCRSQDLRHHSHKSTVGEMGIIQHSVTLFQERLLSRTEVMGAWRLRDTEDASSLVLCDSSKIPFKMINILIWNCRGAMKPQFRNTVMDLVEWHTPMLMVITETRMSGARAIEMIESLPFDGSVIADTIGFAGGIWMLWRTDLVHVEVLASIEQEIHAIIRVRSQSLTWIISAIYASPRFVERCMLWENLKLIANLHDLP